MDSNPRLPQPMSICEEADKIVTNDRQASYGTPAENFRITADMLNAAGFCFRGEKLKAEDVGLMMILVKAARQSFKHKRDSLVDICGYAKCIDMIHEDKQN
ncbi:MAG: hypothetical protein EBU46_00845 [Nitrosomonadaceae bacterium]|nr:hypothetical protein [Nitrosomonadaceae bacterium]